MNDKFVLKFDDRSFFQPECDDRFAEPNKENNRV